MTMLVTGQAGFVGGWMTRAHDAVGLLDGRGDSVDLRDGSAVLAAIERIHPTAVVHLAAQSAVPESFRHPEATYQANFLGTQNLFDALKTTGFTGRFLFVSTAEVYGMTPDEALPICEATPPAPLNPYAVSKVAAEVLSGYQQRVEGLDIVIARPFNHIGPGQSTRFAIADFAKAIVEMKLGRRPAVLEVGDLDVTRDFTDVRDVIVAYGLLIERGQRGTTYNVCTGVERHMAAAVGTLAELAGVQLEIRVDPARLRKAGQRRSCGDNRRLRVDTGWQPAIEWRTSLADILRYWEQQLA